MSELGWSLRDERPGPVGYMRVVTRTYGMPDGSVSDWDILAHRVPRSVAVVALTDDGQVVLVRQFRPGPGRVLLELPGGRAGSVDEAPEETARRELLEETGYTADRFEVAGRTWLASYATDERVAVIATGCRHVGDQQLDAEEFCEVRLVDVDVFVAHVRGGQLTDTDLAFLALDRLGLLAGDAERASAH